MSIGSAIFAFAGLRTVTDRPTNHASRSATIGWIYVRVVLRRSLKIRITRGPS